MRKFSLKLTAALIVLVLYPLAAIWALNALFGLSISYSLSACAAVIILQVPRLRRFFEK